MFTTNILSVGSVFAAMLLMLSFSNISAAQVTQITASVDRNPILLDESARLSVIATGNLDRDAIDFSVLNNAFRVSVPSFSKSTQIINGNMSQTVSWTVSLYPKQTGTFNIPSFEIEGKQSSPFQINVLPVDTANSSQPREYYVEASVDSNEIYLQQQLLYTVKIYLSQDIQRGQLSLPELEGALIEQIGEDDDYQEIINGVRYRIIERKYAIIPQSSGNFTITGPIFEAEVATNSRRSFANFGRTKSIARRAPDLDLTVKSIPNNYAYTWLPSEFVEVTEQWQGNEDGLMVGEPVTRSITLTALGLTKEQLPVIDLPYHPSFKVYPEQPTLATVQRNDRLIAQGVFNSAIIPEQAGSFVLPEVRIPWFNVKTGSTDYAVVPARTVNVQAKPVDTSQTTTGQSSQITPALNPNDDLNMPSTLSDSGSVPQSDAYGLNWLHYTLIASNIVTLLLALTLLSKIRGSNAQTTQKPNHANAMNTNSEAQAFAQLKSLLEQGKTDNLDKSLDQWLGKLIEAQHHSVSTSLSKYGNDDAIAHYNNWLSSQYNNQQSDFDFAGFIKCLEILRTQYQQQSTQVMSALYPA